MIKYQAVLSCSSLVPTIHFLASPLSINALGVNKISKVDNEIIMKAIIIMHRAFKSSPR